MSDNLSQAKEQLSELTSRLKSGDLRLTDSQLYIFSDMLEEEAEALRLLMAGDRLE